MSSSVSITSIFQRALRSVLTKRLATNPGSSFQDAFDWSAALNAVLMLPIGALLSLAIKLNLTGSSANVLVSWQGSTPFPSTASHYILGVILSFLFASWGAMYRPLPVGSRSLGKTAFVLFVYFAVVLAGLSLLTHIVTANAGRFWPWIGLLAYLASLGFYKYKFSTAAIISPSVGLFDTTKTHLGVSWAGYAADLCAVIFIFMIFWPYSIDALLNQWDLKNPHVVAYVIGPAQLSQVPGNLPNVNFFSQYSIGAPYLFSWLLSADLVQVIERYLYSITVLVISFCALYYYLASRLYTSRFWGFAFTLLMAALLANALYWSEPSSAPVRFWFFPICAIVLLKYGLNNTISITVASVLCAFAIMNNTETGVHTTIAYAAVLFISSPSWPKFFQNLALLLFATIASAAVLCFICYGPNVFSFQFIAGNLKPLFVYSVVGYGNYPLLWHPKHWTWMQCFVLPGFATLVLALLYYKTWTTRALNSAEQTLVFCSAFGLLLLLKFMYRSYMAIGHINSAPLIIVLGFCFVFFSRKVFEIKHWRPGLANGVAFVLLLSVFLIFLQTFRENAPGRDIKYATTWLTFPSIMNRVIGLVPGGQKSTPLAEKAAEIVTDADVALIRKYSEPESEPVWIYANEDWAYLIKARRRPASTVLPLPYILMGQDLATLKEKFSRAPQYVFLESKFATPPLNAQVSSAFPNFAKDYKLIQRGNNLDAYKRN